MALAVALGARTLDRCEDTARELDESGARTIALTADIDHQQSIDEFVAATLERFGRLDGVAVVAANVTTIADATGIEDDVWRGIVRHQHPRPAARRVGHPIRTGRSRGRARLTGTQAAYDPKPGMAAYGVTKMGAQVSLMHYLARELGSARIRVNCVETSWMLGPLVQGYMDYMASEQGRAATDVIADIAKDWPIPDMPLDEDVAESFVFLLSDRARMITGQTIRVNAGEYLA